MKKISIISILFVYFIFSIATLYFWEKRGINTVTGDEPHYLVMASGIVKHASLEQTEPYREEFKTKEIYKPGLAPQDAEPSPTNTHAVAGPNGLFNVHNIGLPLLLSMPFMLGGVLGAKLFMIFCGSLIIVLSWKFASIFSEDKRHNFWAVIAAGVSLPLIPASNQIYPDILAGLISLVGLYWFITAQEKRLKIHEILLASAIVFLPWLQIKFAATCVLIVLAVVVKIYLDSKDIQRVLRILLVASISCIALALYNYCAFGKISGPYESGALELSKTSLMVLLGLHFDQNQGFLIQNPVNLIGILAIGWVYRFNRTFAFIWGGVFLSLIVPNALHPNWYGGGSFSGRFGWAAAVVFIIPTVYGLLKIGKNREKIFRLVIAGSVLLQLYFFYQYAVSGTNLYNRGAVTWFDAYSIFYFPIHSWLPMLYSSEWAFGYTPNYAWLVLTCSLLLMGFICKENFYSKAPILAISFFALIFVSGLFKYQQASEIIFEANQLPSQTGKTLDLARFAEQNTDSPGFLNYGPYFPLRKGKYEVALTYSSLGTRSENIGWFDIYDSTTGTQISQVPIQGTDNTNQELKFKFQVDQWKPNLFEFRTYWNGLSKLKVQRISLKKL